MTPAEQKIIQALLGGAMPGGPLANAGMPGAQAQKPQAPPPSIMDPAGFQAYQEGSLGADWTFAPGPGTRVADAKGTAFGSQITPAGVGDQSSINNAAFAYNALMNSLGDYSQNFQPGADGSIPNVPMMPGVERDTITAQRRNIQMQMKELYNLGVLNGPDLELMDQIMFNPLSIKNKALDMVGIADSEERAAANIDEVKRMMRALVEPKLKSAGVTVEDVYSDSMSDDDFRAWLESQ